MSKEIDWDRVAKGGVLVTENDLDKLADESRARHALTQQKNNSITSDESTTSEDDNASE